MRTVTRWTNGEKTQTQAEPTPFGPERAQEIHDASRSWFGPGPHQFMTDGEIAYVHEVWDTLPGHTCFMDALLRIARPDLNIVAE